MMTPRHDLLDHAVDLFPAPEGSVAEVERDVARRHRNRRLAAVSVVVAIWVVIGAAVLTLRSPDESLPIQRVPSPTVAPGSVDARGWPTTTKNRAGVYSWGSGCLVSEEQSCIEGFMHNGYPPGEGDVTILIDGDAGHLVPHEGTPVTVFGYEGTHRRRAGESGVEGKGAACEDWMVDIQGTTVTITLCAKPRAPAAEVAEAHDVIESIVVESPADNDFGFRLIFTLTTGTWDSG